jgi:hypothetical protein
MSTSLTLSLAEIPEPILRSIRAIYQGRKVRLETRETITLSGTYWDGGSRSSYFLAPLDGSAAPVGCGTDHPVFDRRGIEGQTYPIPEGYLGLERVISCGKDLGVRLLMHPRDIARLLPPASESSPFSALDKAILEIYRTIKGGAREGELDRIRVGPDGKIGDDYSLREGIQPDWRAARENLIEQGALKRTSAGAISLSAEARRVLEMEKTQRKEKGRDA